MRILLLTQSFNSLSQRLWVELAARGHQLSVEFDIHDEVTREALDLFAPDLILAPTLKRRIPDDVWTRVPCWIVHPGPPGDRGPSSLDWAILDGEREWGLSLIQATDELDGGPLLAFREFALRAASKSSLYRRECTEAAVACVLEALDRFVPGRATAPSPTTPSRLGRPRPLLRAEQRAIDWTCDPVEQVLRKLRSGDGEPGCRDRHEGETIWLHEGAPGPAAAAPAGSWIGRCVHGEGLLRAGVDGSVWIGQIARSLGARGERLKLGAVQALPELAASLPLIERPDPHVRYTRHGAVGVLHFDFPQGALSTARCVRLQAALRAALAAPEPVLVLAGGAEFWSNGMDLASIEADPHPADASWRNINAIDDVAECLLSHNGKWVIAALAGNAGAGGVFLALAADAVWLSARVVLNPHYRNMGNLYGSEYWTYLLPRRLGAAGAERLMAGRLPLSARAALDLGLVDAVLEARDPEDFLAASIAAAQALVDSGTLPQRLAAKAAQRAADVAQQPLLHYREAELKHMQRNFYGFDTSYHVARHDFIVKTPRSRTPLYLARHRQR